jgi:hypothetical protein
VVVLVGVAAVILLAVVVLPGVLFGGGGESDDAQPAAAVGSPTTTTTAASLGSPDVETFEVYSSKNPFKPLAAVDAPASEPTGAETVDTTDTTVPLLDPAFDDGFVVVVPDDNAPIAEDPSTSPPTTAGPPPRQPDRVSLLEVFTDAGGQVVGSVRVNDITYQVAEGDEFATSYRAVDLDISSRCGQLLFGDEGFGLCEGDEVLK